MEFQRVLAVGDVHGCLEELRDLLRTVEYRPGKDRLVFLGDLVDRGPDPVGVVRVVRHELRAESVRGNHDEKAGRWRRREAARKLNGTPNNMKRPNDQRLVEWEALPEEDAQWLDTLPWTVDLVHGWVGVHAGFEPSVPLAQQKGDRMCRVRYADIDGHMATTHYPGHVPASSMVWTTWSRREFGCERVETEAELWKPWPVWKAPTHVVYGHAVHDTALPRVDKRYVEVNAQDDTAPAMFYGVDTGCCFGGVLTCWVYNVRGPGGVVETVSVPSRGVYADLKLAGAE